MPEFMARKENGAIVPDQDYLEEFDRVPEGVQIKVKTTNPRSKPHLGLYFAAISKAYDNWPEDHPEQFTCSDHFRQFLECKSGMKYTWSITKTNDVSAMAAQILATYNLAQTSKTSEKVYLFQTEDNEKLYLHFSKSISYSKMSQDEFNTISQRISDLLKEHTGVSLEEFRMQGEAA